MNCLNEIRPARLMLYTNLSGLFCSLCSCRSCDLDCACNGMIRYSNVNLTLPLHSFSLVSELRLLNLYNLFKCQTAVALRFLCFPVCFYVKLKTCVLCFVFVNFFVVYFYGFCGVSANR